MYRGHMLSYRHNHAYQSLLRLTAFGRSRTLLFQFVQEAQESYQARATGSLQIFEPAEDPDTSYAGSEGWEHSLSRPKRPLDSVVLPKGVKEQLIHDVRDFMAEKRFYTDRGIPYRRGWLFYGVPGGGKTSLSRSCACNGGKELRVSQCHCF